MSTSLIKWINKRIKPQLSCGQVLELGPGCIYPGLKLVAGNAYLDLVGVGYSSDERQRAQDLARSAGLARQCQYLDETVQLDELPEQSMDAVISFGALHQWEHPAKVMNQIDRVLKQGGLYFIGDARGGRSWLRRWTTIASDSQLKQLYQQRQDKLTLAEIKEWVVSTKLEQAQVVVQGPDLWISNAKEVHGAQVKQG